MLFFVRIKNKFLIILIMAAAILLGFQNCQGYKSNPKSDVNPSPNDNVINQNILRMEEVQSLRFYYGGYFPPPGEVNWAYDYVITMSDGRLSAKMADGLCGKSATVNVKDLINYFNGQAIRSPSSQMACPAYGGMTIVSFKYKDGLTRTVSLNNCLSSSSNYTEAFVDYLQVSEYMKNLLDKNETTATFCQ